MAAGAALVAGTGCTDETPTSGDSDRIPVEATTVEVTLPFDEFADEYRQVGGFGRASGLGVAIVAHEFEEELEAHGLFRFREYPGRIDVPDPDDPDETVSDTLITPVEASVRFSFDPDFSLGEPPYELVLSTTSEMWDVRTATWEMAVDTLGGRQEWSAPGGGVLTEVGRGQWDPEEGDSAVVEVDPEAIDAWEDPEDLTRGLHVATATEGSHLLVREVELDLGFESEANPDTIVTETVVQESRTFVYDPLPDPDDVMLLGGAPAWRSVFRVDLPEQFDEPMGICQQLECPVELTPEVVVHAEVLLHPEDPPPGFSIKDSVRVDAREVLQPEQLPRAPIRSIPGATQAVTSDAFQPGGNTREPVTMPLTNYVRAFLDFRARPPEEIDDEQEVPSETLTLLVVPEPFRLDIPTFGEPGQENEPELRLILTVSDGMRLP